MGLPIRDTIQDCNLNFLLGSGLSSPYLKTLGQIEILLTTLEQASLEEEQKELIRCSLYKSYFDGVISKNSKILKDDPAAQPILNNYNDFLKTINAILLLRKSTILGKEANLFTTNIDVFLEKAIERIGLECNDGFSGRYNPWFALSNFKKAHSKRSLQYDNLSELPTVNLLKLHGSLTWQIAEDDQIVFSSDLAHVHKLERMSVTPALVIPVDQNTSLDSLTSASTGKSPDATVRAFQDAFDDLPIVNPTKAKFRKTLLNQTHYELLRIYSNELEKENTVLFVLGFSFTDEHIREVTLRAANSNPTLLIQIYAYDSQSAAEIGARFPSLNIRNNNVEIISPPKTKDGVEAFKYNLPTINKKLLRAVIEPTSGDSASPPVGGES